MFFTIVSKLLENPFPKSESISKKFLSTKLLPRIKGSPYELSRLLLKFFNIRLIYEYNNVRLVFKFSRENITRYIPLDLESADTKEIQS